MIETPEKDRVFDPDELMNIDLIKTPGKARNLETSAYSTSTPHPSISSSNVLKSPMTHKKFNSNTTPGLFTPRSHSSTTHEQIKTIDATAFELISWADNFLETWPLLVEKKSFEREGAYSEENRLQKQKITSNGAQIDSKFGTERSALLNSMKKIGTAFQFGSRLKFGGQSSINRSGAKSNLQVPNLAVYKSPSPHSSANTIARNMEPKTHVAKGPENILSENTSPKTFTLPRT